MKDNWEWEIGTKWLDFVSKGGKIARRFAQYENLKHSVNCATDLYQRKKSLFRCWLVPHQR